MNRAIDLMDEAVRRCGVSMTKFPAPNYTVAKIAEEAGEVVKAAVHTAEGRDTWAHLEDEMIDLIAMLLRLRIEGDATIGLPSRLDLED